MTESSELAGRPVHSGSKAYRAGVAVAALTAFLSVWTSIVRDDGNAMGFFMTILAVGVGWFAAGFKAAGMARTMLGVAIMQVAVGLLVATAPVTQQAGESAKFLLLCGGLALFWLVSETFFRAASRASRAYPTRSSTAARAWRSPSDRPANLGQSRQ